MSNLDIDDNNRDDHVDDEIFECFSINTKDKNPQSFFLYADAGSGKTRSLVNVLLRLRHEYGMVLRLSGQKIAVITYTNAACDEIKSRLEHGQLFAISTIHSFIWELIKPYQKDIKQCLKNRLANEITEIEAEQAKGRSETKAAVDREKSIISKTKRLEFIEKIKMFSYNPNGENNSRDSLNHSEVIAIGAELIESKPLLQNIFTHQYPILLIDESQDTNKTLMDAFLYLQNKHRDSFTLGLFGDTMQRIYMDGKVDLDNCIPEDWLKPLKVMNHRCPKRIVTLINRIRLYTDKHEQSPRNDISEGLVRLFLCNHDQDKDLIENIIAKNMSDITDDPKWGDSVKKLILEHRMAARRLGFLGLYDAFKLLNSTGFLDGTISGMHLFTELILPIVVANRKDDKFAVMKIVRKHSPLMKIDSSSKDQMKNINDVQDAVSKLIDLWKDNNDPLCFNVLRCISETGLFDIPNPLNHITSRNVAEQEIVEDDKLEEGTESETNSELLKINAWDEAIKLPFSQIEAYHLYTSGNSPFTTHQGVKGLEFPNVMAIIDDEEARGFLFSYDKLFGAKELSKTDIQNETDGKDSSISRTRRLFYVICSRTLESLAIIMYTQNAEVAKTYVVENEWFSDSEVVIL